MAVIVRLTKPWLRCFLMELFYILDGELDLLALELRIRTSENWRGWEPADGGRVLRGGPGATMFVPAGCPHAFANPGTAPARILFLVSAPGRASRAAPGPGA